MIYVSDLMTTKVFTLQRTDTLRDVRTLMQLARVRHIPVTTDGGIFVGLLTHRDLLGYAVSHLAEIEQEEQAEIESSIIVEDIMRMDVLTTAPDILLREAAEVLYRNKYGCLPVLDDTRKLVGIITEADFLRLAIALLHDA
ncbi:MAG: CBS domain-containing protein [Bilophila sp.]